MYTASDEVRKVAEVAVAKLGISVAAEQVINKHGDPIGIKVRLFTKMGAPLISIMFNPDVDADAAGRIVRAAAIAIPK